ncbi:hypothetical protein [Sagittula salina]|uniref:Uncharacterized protein n=1 Tax=Sagittula salina TaxID=2820268 RepID=A0A940S209_9RHOB|nr:hypothetical protein [Sagittula salina]MBP0483636.1 hypothetical protein [Sagittula salina]
MSNDILGPKRFAAFLIAVFCWGSPGNAQSLLHDFENLLERCRVSIEMNEAFDSAGLEQKSVEERHARDWGTHSDNVAWMRPGSELYVVLTEWTSHEGTTRHLCNVGLADEGRALDAVEQALLLRHFLIEQVELIGAGTHEIAGNLSPIPPAVNAGFLLSAKNPNGCRVISVLTFSPDGTFFQAGTGEQAISPCKTE